MPSHYFKFRLKVKLREITNVLDTQPSWGEEKNLAKLWPVMTEMNLLLYSFDCTSRRSLPQSVVLCFLIPLESFSVVFSTFQFHIPQIRKFMLRRTVVVPQKNRVAKFRSHNNYV